MKKAIILLSGGLDSAAVLFYAKQKGFGGLCLNFIYGQKHVKETVGARKLAGEAGFPFYSVKIAIPGKASALTNKMNPICNTNSERIGRVIPSTYVPARNIIFLSFALSWAETEKCGHIFMGANVMDYSGYPDCRPVFIKSFQKMAQAGTKSGVEGKAVKISAPFLYKTKSQIIKTASKLGVPFELTWSCYRGGKHPCGRCESCKLRAKGFRETGLADPLIKLKK